MLHLVRPDPPPTDRELLQRITLGDVEAFDTLVERHLESLLNYAFRLVQSRHIAEEVVQDVFGWVWEHRVALMVRESVQAYLFHAVRNRAFNHQRDVRTQARREAEYAQDDSTHAGVLSPGPVEQVEHQELASALHAAIDTLPPRRREIVLLRARHFSYVEIAEALGISVKTVEAQITRAFQALRERLAPWVD